MLFNSIEFLLFFPTVVTLYFLIPHRFRWLLILIASSVFYMAFVPAYILILAAIILVHYVAGLRMGRMDGKDRKLWLILSVVAALSILFTYKYFNFVSSNFNGLAELIGWNYPIETLQLILPIGLSFFTFQSLSYVIEVYRGKHKPERHIGVYAAYVMFYPQLVAGPIERPQNLLRQFSEKHHFDYNRVTSGLKLMAWGMFKKVVIADRLATLVNPVFADPTAYSGLTLALVTVLFAYQIYCDFSGYSDIAIGSAKVMGFKLMNNFERPYFSKSIQEFWRRWHISLSTWFRDYVYIPLGGNRVSPARWHFNIFATFLLSGIWHGANWTFVIWGALHGGAFVISHLTENIRDRFTQLIGLTKLPVVHKVIRVALTFGLVCLAWVFFRANSLDDALFITTHIFSGLGNAAVDMITMDFGAIREALDLNAIGEGQWEFLIALALIVFLEFVHFVQRKGSIRDLIAAKPLVVRWAAYHAFVLMILILGVFGEQQFIYFQF